MADPGGHPIEAVELAEGVPRDDVAPATVRSGLESDRATVRSTAATVAAGLAQSDPDALSELAPALVDRLGDDQRVVVYQSLIALSHVARDDPGSLVPAVDRLVARLSDDLPVIRTLSARILGFVVLERPGVLADHAGALVDAALADPDEVLDADAIADEVSDRHGRRSLEEVNRRARTQTVLARQTVANVLVEVAAHDPDAVGAHVDGVVDLLEDDAGVVTAAADVLRILAEADPALVEPTIDSLCDVLDHPDESVVATAVPALGHAGDPSAVSALRDLAADEDRSAELRELAAETADFLESSGD